MHAMIDQSVKSGSSLMHKRNLCRIRLMQWLPDMDTGRNRYAILDELDTPVRENEREPPPPALWRKVGGPLPAYDAHTVSSIIQRQAVVEPLTNANQLLLPFRPDSRLL